MESKWTYTLSGCRISICNNVCWDFVCMWCMSVTHYIVIVIGFDDWRYGVYYLENVLAIENTCGCIDFKFLKTVFILDNPNLFYIKCWSAHEEAAIQFCVCIVVECVCLMGSFVISPCLSLPVIRLSETLPPNVASPWWDFVDEGKMPSDAEMIRFYVIQPGRLQFAFLMGEDRDDQGH